MRAVTDGRKGRKEVMQGSLDQCYEASQASIQDEIPLAQT